MEDDKLFEELSEEIRERLRDGTDRKHREEIAKSRKSFYPNITLSPEEWEKFEMALLLNRRMLSDRPEHDLINNRLRPIADLLEEDWSRHWEGTKDERPAEKVVRLRRQLQAEKNLLVQVTKRIQGAEEELRKAKGNLKYKPEQPAPYVISFSLQQMFEAGSNRIAYIVVTCQACGTRSAAILEKDVEGWSSRHIDGCSKTPWKTKLLAKLSRDEAARMAARRKS